MSPTPATRLRPFTPTPFGRYMLLAPLATGGMGEIYLARFSGPSGFEKLCVIKKILPHLAAEKDFVERFVHEAKILVKLSHGAIAHVLEMGVHEGAPYLALEFVDGKDLRRVMGRMRDRGEKVPLTFGLHVMARVLDALAYAHRKRDDDEQDLQLVHRDVSPQNILISYEGEVKVIDFGLAKSSLGANKTNPTVILGKFLYMSPEQARHQKVDRRSDLYAVGLCLYELVAGKHPLDEVPPGELITAVAKPSFPPLTQIVPSCPASLAAVVARALSLEPEARFQSAEEFRGKVLSCLLELDPSAGPEAVSHSMRAWFEPEFQTERKLLQAARELASKSPDELLSAGRRTTLGELPAIPFDQDLPTPLPVVRDTPAAGLAALPTLEAMPSPVPPPIPTRAPAVSFSPTPRLRPAEPVAGNEDTAPRARVDERTQPGVSGMLDEILEAPAAELEPTQPSAELPKPPMLFAKPVSQTAPTREVVPVSRMETVPAMARVEPPRPAVLRGVLLDDAAPPAAGIPPPPSVPPSPRPPRSSPPVPAGPRTLSAPSLPTVKMQRPRASSARWVVPLVVLSLLAAVGFVGRDLYRGGMFDSLLGSLPAPVRTALHLKANEEPAVPQPEPVRIKPPSPLPPGVSLGATAAAPVPPPPPAPPPTADDSDLLATMPSTAPEKAHHGAHPAKKKRPATELDREWALTRAAFKKLSRNSPCESEGMGMICQRYDALDSDLQDADPNDASLLARVRQLHKSIERKSAQ